MARHLVDDPVLADPEALGVAFARAYTAEPWRGYGAGPPRVFALVDQGATFEAAARSLFNGGRVVRQRRGNAGRPGRVAAGGDRP